MGPKDRQRLYTHALTAGYPAAPSEGTWQRSKHFAAISELEQTQSSYPFRLPSR